MILIGSSLSVQHYQNRTRGLLIEILNRVPMYWYFTPPDGSVYNMATIKTNMYIMLVDETKVGPEEMN